MINEDYGHVCSNIQCRGRAVPATWKYVSNKWGTSYYCTNHAWKHGNGEASMYGKWVRLTPNQRPVSVKE